MRNFQCISAPKIWLSWAFSLLSLLCSQGVSAQDYFWRHNYNSPNYPSAVEACKAVFILRAEHYPGITYSGIYINPNKPYEAACTGKRSDGSNAGFIHSVTRYGDRCTAPAVYNPQTGACDGPQPDKCEPTIGQIVHHEFKFKSLGEDGNPSTDPPITVCKNSCQYSHTYKDFTSKRDFGPPDMLVGSFEYKGNGISCTPSATNPSVFDQPPSKDPVTTPPNYSATDSCSNWVTQPDGTMKRSCTSETSYKDEGEVECKGGTAGSGFSSSVTCTPTKKPPEKTDKTKLEETEKKTNPDGSTETTTKTDTTETKCKGTKPCESTSKTETTTEKTDPNGNKESTSGNCVGTGCNPEKPSDSSGEGEDERPESSVVAGACDASVQCTGDALACELIRQQKAQRCADEDFRTVTPAKVQELKDGLQGEFSGEEYQPLTATAENTFDLGNMVDTSRRFSSSCPAVQDINVPYMGSSISIGASQWISMLCPYLAWFGYFIVAFAMRRGAEIVAQGMS